MLTHQYPCIEFSTRMGTITHKWVWAIALIPAFICATEPQLPKRIKLHTSNELHQVLSDIATALETLSNTSVKVDITLNATPPLLGGVCLLLITGLVILLH
jgi:hypothetical protein